MEQRHHKDCMCILCEKGRKEAKVSESPSVTGYVPTLEEVNAYSSKQAEGFIVGSLITKFNLLGVPVDRSIKMANLILAKVGT